MEVWEAAGVMVAALIHVVEQADELQREVHEIRETVEKIYQEVKRG